MSVIVTTEVPAVPLTATQARLWRSLLRRKVNLQEEWLNIIELACLGAINLQKQPNGQWLIVPLLNKPIPRSVQRST